MSEQLIIRCQTCHATQDAAGVWHQGEPGIGGAVSHGLCPECSAAYREELARLKAQGITRLSDFPWARAVGCSALHPTQRDSDGGARVVEVEP